MYLQLVRESFTDKATEGKIFINGAFECYTLEDKDRLLEDSDNDKVYSESAIPRGTYDVVLTKSNRFQKVLPELLNVPRFTGIRMHSGNKAQDSEGCILVGMTNTSEDDNWIGNSRAALSNLIHKMKVAKSNGEEITIEVV